MIKKWPLQEKKEKEIIYRRNSQNNDKQYVTPRKGIEYMKLNKTLENRCSKYAQKINLTYQ